MKRKVLVLFVVVVMLFSLTGCGVNKKKEPPTPFAIKENLDMMTDENISLDIPAYFYTQYKATGSLDIEGVEMMSKTLKYNFSNWKREKQENNKDFITFDCEITGNMEFKFDNISGAWTYSFIYADLDLFDYNTGDILKKKQVSVDNTVNLYEDKLNKEKNEEDFKYTKINWDDKEFDIGTFESSYFYGWVTPNKDTVDGKTHYVIPVKLTVSYKIEVPENYDGVAIYMYKKGMTKEKYLKDQERITKYNNLKKEKEEKGSSEEFDKLDAEENRVKKLIDPDDEARKEYTKDDFYCIKIQDMLDKQNKE